MDSKSASNVEEVDLSAHPTAAKLVSRCIDFFDEMQNLTPGKDLEARLNTEYGSGTPIYEDFCSIIRQGLQNEEGWVATTPVDGPKYRRSRIINPCANTRYFSITTVYMDSEHPYRGQYHQHPYGEINCVIPIDVDGRGLGAELMGMQGWQGAGWTSPGPGTHHYPEVKNGALIALFFLPAGRISYGAEPGMAQPSSL